MPALRRGGREVHLLHNIRNVRAVKPGKAEALTLTAAADILILRGLRTHVPEPHLFPRESARVQRHKMRTRGEKLTVYLGVHKSDNALIIGELYLKAVIDRRYSPAHALELPVDVYRIPDVQIKFVIIIREI